MVGRENPLKADVGSVLFQEEALKGLHGKNRFLQKITWQDHSLWYLCLTWQNWNSILSKLELKHKMVWRLCVLHLSNLQILGTWTLLLSSSVTVETTPITLQKLCRCLCWFQAKRSTIQSDALRNNRVEWMMPGGGAYCIIQGSGPMWVGLNIC